MDLVPHRPVKLSIRSSPAHLPIVRAAIEKMCGLLGFDGESTGEVVLGVDEALTNIIKHAYQGQDDQPIEVKLTPMGEPEPEALEIRLSDRGRYTHPDEIKSRDLSNLRPGGLGVHIITECMDKVDFKPRSEGGTVLTMIKKAKSGNSKAKREVSS